MNSPVAILPLDAVLMVEIFAFATLCFAALSLEEREAYGFRWGWLAAFALGRVTSDFFGMLGLIAKIGFWVRPTRELLLVAAFLCLVEFARAGRETQNGKTAGLWIHPLLLGMVALSVTWGWTAMELVTRTVLGGAGGLGACWMLWRFRGKGASWLRAVGAGIALTVVVGFISGLIVFYLPLELVRDVGGGVLMSAPFKTAHAGVALALSGAVWGALIANRAPHDAEGSVRRAFLRAPWPILGITLSLAAGCLLAHFVGGWAERNLRRELLERTRGLAAAIESEQVVLLRGEPEDEPRPEYQHLVRRLAAIAEAQLDIHDTYLLGERRGEIVYLANVRAQRARRRDEFLSRPGAPFARSGPFLERAFRKGTESLEGPVSDAYGTWLSPLVPILEEGHGPVVALLGQNFEAARWEREMARTRVPFLMAALFVALGISGGQAYRMQREHSAGRLAFSETKYRELFERMLNGFALHELVRDARGEPWDFRYLEVNPSFERLTGLSREQVIGRTIREAVPGVEPVWIETYLRVMATGETERLEHFAAPLGRWYRVSAYRPAPEQLVTIFSDVTDRKRLEADLRSSLERFNAALEQAQGVIYVRRFDPDRYEFVGENIRALLGCSPAEFTPERWNATIVFEERMNELRDLALDEALRRFRTGNSQQWLDEVLVRTPHRGLRRFLDVATPLREDNGRVTGCIGLLQDITTLRQAEEERMRTQGLLRGIAEASRALLEEENPTRAIRRALECLGKAADVQRAYWFERHPHPVTGEPCISQRCEWCAEGIVPYENDPGLQNLPVNSPVFRRWEAVLSRRQPIQGLVRDVPAEERAVLQAQGVVSIVGLPILLGGEKYAGFIGFDECRREREWSEAEMNLLAASAATVGAALERHRAQNSMRTAIRRFEAIFETNPMVAIQGFSSDGTVRHWNRASETLYGWTSEEAVGQRLQELIFPPESAPSFETALRTMREKPVPADGVEWRTHARDGRERFVYAAMFPLVKDGTVEEVFCMEVDVSERLRLEEQLRHAQKMEAVGRLAGGVAHDFNNLLVVIGGYAELLLGSMADGHPDRTKIEGIHRAAQSAGTLTRQLLLFSRKQAPQTARFELGRLAEESGEMLRRVLGENIRLEIRRTDHGAPILGDPNHFNQILLNFALNARDAMPKGGEFTLAVCRKTVAQEAPPSVPGVSAGDYIELRVADTGGGMSPEVQTHIFEPFFTTKAAGRGTGLGLSIVYGIVRQANGHVHVESREGLGTTFTILVPVAAAAAEEATPHARKTAAAEGGTERILVVEDNESVRDFILDALRSAGYAVVEAANAEEALERMEEEGAHIRLVLTDVIMPGMGGIELARRLRAERRHLHVVLMSGFSNDDAVFRAADEMGCVFIRKPFDLIELRRLIRRLLDSATLAGTQL
ncbi:MAG: PAS domain S-box protein [Verrucomicrobiae bacterium]|nr:PAS domain S-box protein [Verrucomicrobiae bacterium]